MLDPRDLLTYDPCSGKFYWKVTRGKARKDAEAGWVLNGRYVCVTLAGKDYLAHRLAFLFMEGEIPVVHVDHINGDGLDNRWSNLRPATVSQNLANQKLSSANRSGFKGVCWHAGNGRWFARINVQGKQISLGTYLTKEEAAEAYDKAAIKYFEQFAKTNRDIRSGGEHALIVV